MTRYTGEGNDRAYAYSADGERLFSHDYTTSETTWRLRDLGNRVVREWTSDATGAWTWEQDLVHRGARHLIERSLWQGIASIPTRTLLGYLSR